MHININYSKTLQKWRFFFFWGWGGGGEQNEGILNHLNSEKLKLQNIDLEVTILANQQIVRLQVSMNNI